MKLDDSIWNQTKLWVRRKRNKQGEIINRKKVFLSVFNINI